MELFFNPYSNSTEQTSFQAFSPQTLAGVSIYIPVVGHCYICIICFYGYTLSCIIYHNVYTVCMYCIHVLCV